MNNEKYHMLIQYNKDKYNCQILDEAKNDCLMYNLWDNLVTITSISSNDHDDFDDDADQSEVGLEYKDFENLFVKYLQHKNK